MSLGRVLPRSPLRPRIREHSIQSLASCTSTVCARTSTSATSRLRRSRSGSDWPSVTHPGGLVPAEPLFPPLHRAGLLSITLEEPPKVT